MPSSLLATIRRADARPTWITEGKANGPISAIALLDTVVHVWTSQGTKEDGHVKAIEQIGEKIEYPFNYYSLGRPALWLQLPKDDWNAKATTRLQVLCSASLTGGQL